MTGTNNLEQRDLPQNCHNQRMINQIGMRLNQQGIKLLNQSTNNSSIWDFLNLSAEVTSDFLHFNSLSRNGLINTHLDTRKCSTVTELQLRKALTERNSECIPIHFSYVED